MARTIILRKALGVLRRLAGEKRAAQTSCNYRCCFWPLLGVSSSLSLSLWHLCCSVPIMQQQRLFFQLRNPTFVLAQKDPPAEKPIWFSTLIFAQKPSRFIAQQCPTLMLLQCFVWLTCAKTKMVVNYDLLTLLWVFFVAKNDPKWCRLNDAYAIIFMEFLFWMMLKSLPCFNDMNFCGIFCFVLFHGCHDEKKEKLMFLGVWSFLHLLLML